MSCSFQASTANVSPPFSQKYIFEEKKNAGMFTRTAVSRGDVYALSDSL